MKKSLILSLLLCALLGSLFACTDAPPAQEEPQDPPQDSAAAAYQEALAALHLAPGEAPPEIYTILYDAPSRDFSCVFTETREEAAALCPVNDPDARPDAMWALVWAEMKPDPFRWDWAGLLLPDGQQDSWGPEEIATAFDSSFAIYGESYTFRFTAGDCVVTLPIREGDAAWRVDETRTAYIEVNQWETMPKVELLAAPPEIWPEDGEIYFFVNNLLSGSYLDGIWYTAPGPDPVDGIHVRDKTYYLGDALKKPVMTGIAKETGALVRPSGVYVELHVNDPSTATTDLIPLPALLKPEYAQYELFIANIYHKFYSGNTHVPLFICVTSDHDPRPLQPPQEDAVSQEDRAYLSGQYSDIESIAAYRLDLDRDGSFEARLLTVERGTEDLDMKGALFLSYGGVYYFLDAGGSFGSPEYPEHPTYPGLYDLNGDGYCEIVMWKNGSYAGYARFADETWGEIFYVFTAN